MASAIKKTLKSENTVPLTLFVTLNLCVFLMVYLGSTFTYSSFDNIWQKFSAKDGFLVLCVPLMAVILTGFFNDVAKARLVFFRWIDPLPGCRVFSEMLQTDPRIQVDVLKKKYGEFPQRPNEQNALWYSIYKKYSNNALVKDAHKLYLLTRDMTGLSMTFFVIFSPITFLLAANKKAAVFYSVSLFIQYLIVAASARSYGRRFVLHVIVEDSCAK
jgi:hypothetical protein